MGWTDWFQDGSDKCSEKTESHKDGSTTEHYLRSSGDKSDHSHVVVNKDSSGKITSAHGTPPKSRR